MPPFSPFFINQTTTQIRKPWEFFVAYIISCIPNHLELLAGVSNILYNPYFSKNLNILFDPYVNGHYMKDSCRVLSLLIIMSGHYVIMLCWKTDLLNVMPLLCKQILFATKFILLAVGGKIALVKGMKRNSSSLSS